MKPNILTVAGSDCSGGAGIQADLKTIQALGGYGLSVITVITAQNTVGVQKIFDVSSQCVAMQLDSVLNDIAVNSVKIGALVNTDIIREVSIRLRKNRFPHVVLDPVMVSKSGHRLVAQEATVALMDFLAPVASVVTPNIFEAEALANCKISSKRDVESVAMYLLKNFSAVLVKGGHVESSEYADDFLTDRTGQSKWLCRPRIPSNNLHGTGCTYSAAIATFLSNGFGLFDSVEKARDYLQSAIHASRFYRLGSGQGPVEHSWEIH